MIIDSNWKKAIWWWQLGCNDNWAPELVTTFSWEVKLVQYKKLKIQVCALVHEWFAKTVHSKVILHLTYCPGWTRIFVALILTNLGFFMSWLWNFAWVVYYIRSFKKFENSDQDPATFWWRHHNPRESFKLSIFMNKSNSPYVITYVYNNCAYWKGVIRKLNIGLF